jgi:hypothetical protein
VPERSVAGWCPLFSRQWARIFVGATQNRDFLPIAGEVFRTPAGAVVDEMPISTKGTKVARSVFGETGSRKEGMMLSSVTRQQAIAEFRRLLPASTNTARSIDRGVTWRQTAIDAVIDGYIDEPDELDKFVEICLRKHIVAVA